MAEKRFLGLSKGFRPRGYSQQPQNRQSKTKKPTKHPGLFLMEVFMKVFMEINRTPGPDLKHCNVLPYSLCVSS